MATRRTPRSNEQVSSTPRIRFNHGYHDGAFAASRGLRGNGFVLDMSTHFDRVYAAGVIAGREDQHAGAYAENSDTAWTTYSQAAR